MVRNLSTIDFYSERVYQLHKIVVILDKLDKKISIF